MALHAREPKRQQVRETAARRHLPLRVVLVVLALVPSLAMTALWAVNTVRLYGDWHSVKERNVAADASGLPTASVFFDLQTERQLSAATLADPAAYQAKLATQRGLTDKAISDLEALGGSSPADIRQAVAQVSQSLRLLAGYRAAVDKGTATQQQIYTDYTGMIAVDLQLFMTLSNVGLANVDFLARPAVDSLWGLETLSREDAILTPGIVSGSLNGAQRSQLAQLVGAEQFIYVDEVLPMLPAAIADGYRKLMAGSAWTQKSQIEQTIASEPASAGETEVSAALGAQWRASIAAIMPQLEGLNATYAATLTAPTDSELNSQEANLIADTAIGAAGVLLVVVTTLVLTGSLRRRILALRTSALDMQVRLPDLVERLRRGEDVEPDAELPEIASGRDELGMLGQALNAARRSAVDTAVGQVEQYRGFERLLQRIARRTQLLISLQVKKLNEMERRYEDPEVLDGLFEIDHLAARLRRYEENLVILGGGQPQRRWRKPVPLLDVLRSAQGEVQDYRRIRIETDSGAWLSERAVGPMVHVLAELMENAVSFSKPPAPVEVTVSRVERGLVIEIEDRGMGMEPEQYERANRLMADPPKMDMASRSDDVRLGMFVVARLAANLGLLVELRPSPYGGTRVVVLVPAELVVDGGPQAPDEFESAPVAERPAEEAIPRQRGAESEVVPLLRARRPLEAGSAGAGGDARFGREPSRLDPLPRRVRMASLSTELREPRTDAPDVRDGQPEFDPASTPRLAPGRSGATVGAFQRQSRIARSAAETDQQDPGTDHDQTPTEDAQR